MRALSVGNFSFLKSTSIYLAAAALTAGVPLLLLPILTRMLTPEEYGRLAMFSAATQIFGITTGLNTHGAVGMKYFDRDKLDFPQFVSSCLILVLLGTGFTMLFVSITLPWLENITKLPGRWLIVAVLFSASGSSFKFGSRSGNQARMPRNLELYAPSRERSI
jgi:O-antigen/teichoic acid export membrane protein